MTDIRRLLTLAISFASFMCCGGSVSTAFAGFQMEAIGFPAEIAASGDNAPVYRFRNDYSGKYFYTLTQADRDFFEVLHPDWGHVNEGVVFYAYPAPKSGTVPVYQLYNTISDNHFYTTSSAEKDYLTITRPEWGYIYDKIAFYVFAEPTAFTKPVYRFYNPATNMHFYTASELEKSSLLNGNLGPDMTVGLWNADSNSFSDKSFSVVADKEYVIVSGDGTVVATIPAGKRTRVDYSKSKNKLKIYESVAKKYIKKEVRFKPSNTAETNAIFTIKTPNSSFDEYRGSISVRYSDATKKVWVINKLPLEQYLWGIGEITGTGDQEYNKTMTTAFRTYGLWKILYSTKYASEGFVVDATPGNQVYYGYDWEKRYPRIRLAAQETNGRIAKHGGDIALTPYSSWTDGRTRSFLERWGSSAYPWCQSVPDPYGKHTSLSTEKLVEYGNHMVGISAHGALELATTHDWTWERILPYYLTGISIPYGY